ncbi:MAG: D-aminoacyl-tRNA deacylase [Phycisphaerales bacterium]
MIAVVQRVREAEVVVAATGYSASIGPGVVVLLGVENDDDEDTAIWMARKIASLRIFADDEGNLNRSLLDIGGEALVVSQFTLAGNCRKGTRPSFGRAAPAEKAQPLYESFARRLNEVEGIETRTGVFQAMMEVRLTNDGPVTLIVRSPASFET